MGAVSVGMVGGKHLLDLNYEEDSAADVDLNLVLTASGKILEIQGTAEGAAFSRSDLDSLVDLGTQGIETILAACAKEVSS